MKPPPRSHLLSPGSIWPLWAALLALAGASFAATPREEATAILQQAATDEKDPAKLEEALRQIDALAARAADDASVHFARGWLLSRLKREGESIASYRAALGRDPGFTEAHYNLGVLLAETGDREAAIHEFDEAVRLDPTHIDALYNAGQANYDLERYGVALARWRAVQKLTPDDFQVARKVLQSFNALSMWEEAAGARDNVIRILRDKRDPSAVNTTMFCFDQLPMPDNRVFAYEYLTPPKDGTVWLFKITDLAQKKTLVQIELVRDEGTKHVLRVKGQPGKIAPREFAEAPAWRDLRPVVRDWAARLMAAAAAQ